MPRPFFPQHGVLRRRARRYLHVYASGEEVVEALGEPKYGMTLVKGFFHATIEKESVMRDLFDRVHVCRRYELAL